MLDGIDTPTLLLDKQRCLLNIERMVAKAQIAGVRLRPHFKTHQSRLVGSWFRQAGIQQIATSSLSMARYFMEDGWRDITVAFPVNLLEADRIRYLSRHCRLQLLALDPDVIRQLDSVVENEVGLFLKIDVGTRRTGIAAQDHPAIERCLEALAACKHLVWHGFLAHAGHTYGARNLEEIREIYLETTRPLLALKQRYHEWAPGIGISFGDTPSCTAMARFEGIDELRPGNFVFYDCMQEQIGVCNLDEIAVAMACPVVAVHADRREVIVYGGGIHFGKDAILAANGARHFGIAVAPGEETWSVNGSDTVLKALSQEHGVVSMPQGIPDGLRPGSVLLFLPVHSCMTAQCMGSYTVIPGGSTADHFAGVC
ncbi:MAG: alanine racemase [Saprospiraceae bacterium]|nr:alanine racemase [Saprospiraceae bacterium]